MQQTSNTQMRAPWWYNYLAASSMMFCFAAYLGMQSFLTSTIDVEHASNALTIVFFWFGAGQFGAAAAIDFFGLYWAMVLGVFGNWCVWLLIFEACSPWSPSF
jgi:hypothetical protein